MPGPWTSTHLAMPSSAGLPIRVPGCPLCRAWARPTPCRVAGRRCIEALSSMASEGSGRKEHFDHRDVPRVADFLANRPITDRISDEAESDWDEEPAAVHVEPERQPGPDAPDDWRVPDDRRATGTSGL